MKIVINTCYGGYELSKEAYDYMEIEYDRFGEIFYDDRTNPKLIKCVETLGKKANGSLASLKIVDVPDDVQWKITQYDGVEQIEEKHRIWR